MAIVTLAALPAGATVNVDTAIVIPDWFAIQPRVGGIDSVERSKQDLPLAPSLIATGNLAIVLAYTGTQSVPATAARSMFRNDLIVYTVDTVANINALAATLTGEGIAQRELITQDQGTIT